MAEGRFQELIDDAQADAEQITKIIFCSGKVYYDLLEEKERLKNESTALVRIEQLYPLPHRQIKDMVAKYNQARTYLWVQEEPLNMGAWRFIHHELNYIKLRLIARPESGSPATGSSKFHVIRQQKIIDKAFESCDCPFVDIECGMVCIGNKWRSFEDELKTLNVDMIDSKLHSALKKLE